MIVRLTSNTSGEMIMFAEHARRLFDLLGKECTARGVFTAEQLPNAIGALRTAIEQAKEEARQASADEHDAGENSLDEDEKEKKVVDTVSLTQRATPLLHLMERTKKDGGFILWEAAEAF